MSEQDAGGEGLLEPLAVPTGPAALDLLPRLAQAMSGGRPVMPYAATAPPVAARAGAARVADAPEPPAVPPKRESARPTLTTRPFRMVQPFAMATWPPTATTRGSSWMTRIISFSARWSRIESASRQTKYGAVEALTPTLRASAFPAFSLSMTTSRRTPLGRVAVDS